MKNKEEKEPQSIDPSEFPRRAETDLSDITCHHARLNPLKSHIMKRITKVRGLMFEMPPHAHLF